MMLDDEEIEKRLRRLEVFQEETVAILTARKKDRVLTRRMRRKYR